MKTKKVNSYITSKFVNEYFAIDVSKVLSILEMQRITEVPESPPYMKGVINLRGEVLPVVDSHVKFGLPPLNITMHTCILVLEIKSEDNDIIKLGLMVDHVEEVLEIGQENIMPPPSIGNSIKSKYITGMFQKSETQFIMMLDIDKLLTIKEIDSIKDTEAEYPN